MWRICSYVKWLIHLYETDSYQFWYDSFICVTDAYVWIPFIWVGIIHMWQDSLMCARLTHMCEFHSYVRDLFMCDMIDSCVQDSFIYARVSCICVSSIPMCGTYSYVWDSFIYVRQIHLWEWCVCVGFIHMCGTYSCVTWLIHVCKTHSYLRVSFICVSSIPMCGTCSCVTWLIPVCKIHSYTRVSFMCEFHSYVRDLFICVVLIHICETDSSVSLIDMWHDRETAFKEGATWLSKTKSLC